MQHLSTSALWQAGNCMCVCCTACCHTRQNLQRRLYMQLKDHHVRRYNWHTPARTLFICGRSGQLPRLFWICRPSHSHHCPSRDHGSPIAKLQLQLKITKVLGSLAPSSALRTATGLLTVHPTFMCLSITLSQPQCVQRAVPCACAPKRKHVAPSTPPAPQYCSLTPFSAYFCPAATTRSPFLSKKRPPLMI